jgi:microcystin-dependent protein
MPDITGTLRPPRASSAPAAPVLGQMYYDTGSNILFWWNGTIWVSAQAGSGTAYSQLIGDGASQTFVVTHNLGGRNVIARVYRSAPPYDDVEADIEHTDASTVTVRTTTVPAAGQYTVTVLSGAGAQGPTGTRGSQWYTYASLGTPPPGTFTGEIDGDLAVRAADNEVFQRVAGSWIDQNYKTTGNIYDTDPVGTVKAWTGATIPTNWMLADGRALNRAAYPDLFTALGSTSSPWGLPDGASFNIPDLRGRMLVGSGTGVGGGATGTGKPAGGVALAARSLAGWGGEERHALITAELAVHNHGGATGAGTSGYADTNHYHNVNFNTGGFSADHSHPVGIYQNNIPVTQSGPNGAAVLSSGLNTGGQSANHYHNTTSNTDWQSNSYNNSNHAHSVPALGINNDGSGSTHENMPPWCAVALIVKVTGAQVNAGGALQGATGLRGATWFMYNGVGTPAPGTFVGELDGDWAIRKSDGEEFQRVNGSWVDQNYTNRSTAPVIAARGYPTAALTPVANAWTKVPLQATTFDTAGLVSTSQGRVNIATPGVYQVDASVYSTMGAAAYTNYAVGVYKNGVLYGYGGPITAVQNGDSLTYADMVQCVAGDYLELWVYNAQGTAVQVGNSQMTWLSVALLTAGPGPQGQRGANWYTYTGAGTPAAGTFLNELDGDMAVRASDGEVFKRTSGAWTDQNWKQSTGMATMDTWHWVGASGEPAFQNSWANYSASRASWEQCSFRKYPDGKVGVRGLVAGGAVAVTIFTLPPGYRPPGPLIFACDTNSNAHVRINVNADGTITAANSSSAYLSLANVEFDTDTVTNYAVGTRGSNWYSYTGAGTPAANTFTGEIDNDMAVRTSDSEVFKRLSGAWADQGYKAGGQIASAPVVAKARRGSALSLAAGWNKVPMDTLVFDSLGTIAQTSQGRMVAPYTGYYQINAEMGEAAAELLMYVAVNGSIDTASGFRGTRTPNTPSNTANGLASGILLLNAGDIVEAYVWVGTAVSLTCFAGSVSWMTMALIQAGVGPQGPPGPGGGFSNVQRKWGAFENYVAISTAVSPISDGASGTMRLSLTPTVPSWWEVDGHFSIVQKLDANYNYAYGQVNLTPADQDGVSSGNSILSQHSTVQTYEPRHVTRIFRLAAGTTYTADLGFSPAGGSWQYHAGKQYLSLEGKAWPQ